MPTGSITKFNWVDIFVVIFLFRICYVAAKTGLPAELFKLFGTLVSIFMSFHYCTRLSNLVSSNIGSAKVPVGLLDYFMFLALAIFGYMVVVFLRNLFFRLIKMEAVSALNRWGGLVVGTLRAFLLTGLAIFILVFSGNSYMESSVKSSFSGNYFLSVGPGTYTLLWDGIVSKFSPADKLNKDIFIGKKEGKK